MASSKRKPEADAMTCMKPALDEAKLSLDSLEVPVGCVVVKNGKVVALGRSRTTETRNATEHAEMEVINILIEQWQKHRLLLGEAAEKFSHCTLYVACEPCIMFATSLPIIGVNEVYYGSPNGGWGSILPCMPVGVRILVLPEGLQVHRRNNGIRCSCVP